MGIRSNMGMLAEALKEVGGRYQELAREREENQQDYTVLVWLRPLVRSEFEAFRSALEQYRTPQDGELPPVEKWPIVGPRQSAAAVFVVPASSADVAARRINTYVNGALLEAGILVDKYFSIEVVPSEQ